VRTESGGTLRALALLARAAAGGLVSFHLWLLLRRLADSTIAEPEVLLRWAGAAALGAGALAMRRRGLTLLSGRSGLVFWLLVLLLHVGASPLPEDGARAQEILSVLPLGLAAAGFTPLRLRPPAAGARPIPVAPLVRRRELDSGARRPLALPEGLAARFAPRPPPLLAAAH
jgi:hypothetical protein